MQKIMTATGVRTQVKTIQRTRCIGVGWVGLVMSQHISAAGGSAMLLIGDVFLMNYHQRAEIFRNSLPRRKNVGLPRAFVG